jgi:hypothetical protein
MKRGLINSFSLFLFLLTAECLCAQAICDSPTSSNCDGFPFSELLLQNQQNAQLVEFGFDNFSEYNSGITYYGSTLLRLKIADSTDASPCHWKLKMHITNGGTPIPIQEWETLSSYGSSGAKPLLDLIEVRVSNSCLSSPINGSWQRFASVDNADIVIIDNAIPQSAGSLFGCSGGQTNGEGNYLNNPGEYTFSIDYRIVPGFSRIPGKYELSIKFCLTE